MFRRPTAVFAGLRRPASDNHLPSLTMSLPLKDDDHRDYPLRTTTGSSSFPLNFVSPPSSLPS